MSQLVVQFSQVEIGLHIGTLEVVEMMEPILLLVVVLNAKNCVQKM